MGWNTQAVIAQLVIIEGSSDGLFMYAGTPALGNLIASLAQANGTDQYGNAFVGPVLTTYAQPGGAGTPFFATNYTALGINWLTAATAAGPWSLLDPSLNLSTTPDNLLQMGGILQIIESSNSGQILYLQNNHTNPSFANFLLACAAAADRALAIEVIGDTFDRWQVNSNGDVQWGSGSAAVDITLKRQSANLLGLLTSDLAIGTAGRGLQVKEGSNAKQGRATLSGGTVVVSNTSVTATSGIVLTPQDNSTTGAVRVSARTAGTSFTITSNNPADSGVIFYEIFEAP